MPVLDKATDRRVRSEIRMSVSGGNDTNRRSLPHHVFLADVPLKMAEDNPAAVTPEK
jgi:hypothetical protein